MGTARIPTQGSCLPLTDIDVFFPYLSIVFLLVKIDDVGFTANETLISCPEDIPPRIPPALFDLNFINLLIYIKSRIGYLIYYLSRLIIKKNFSLKYYFYSFGSILYPLFNIKYIIKGDLTFYERDFPIE